MIRQVLATMLLGGLLTGAVLPPQKPTREDQVRNDKKKLEAEGYWLYNDLPRAFTDAKASGKPIVVVLRCIPCEECVKLDDDIIEADPKMKALLEQFVRVRVIATNGLDLSLFQYDTDQSFAVFLLNADGTVYGRYGTRSHRTEWQGDVSVEGMAKAMEGALALHKNYPKNKAQLAAKRGAVPAFAKPELFPSLRAKYTPFLNYEGKVVPSCIHCHMISEAQHTVAIQNRQLTDALLFPYPHPKILGLILDPKERPTVLRTESGSPAAKAGFLPGDVIQTLEGQPLLSLADMQWILNTTPAEGATLKASVLRAGKPKLLTLTLSDGWRRRDDISWRASTWGLRRAALGGMKLDPNPSGKGLLVGHVGQFGPHDLAKRAGLVKGDILTSFDTIINPVRESDLIAHALQVKKPGDTIPLTIQRGGKALNLSFVLPTP
ncbi:Trx7/PDZ domain-containing (seleno)protein [Armatimonas sp.]|uniref:Trx7/PDZ domain-containing (seleno)protein n=1 Tax=Armatimonas sp. TaxID=1872638 RepID=UPI00375167F1